MFVRIDQRSDPRIAPYADVGDHGRLASAGLFVAEGRIVVRRLIADATFPVESVLVTPPARAALDDVLARLAAPVYVADQAIVNNITGFNFHRGCLALARRPAATLSIDALSSASRLLALEAVGNPDNIGGLFRTALALGAGGIVLDAASGDPLYRKAIRTSMAATLRVPFARVDDFPGACAALRSRGFRLVALTPSPDARSIDEVTRQRHERLVLMLGAEGAGLTEETMALADLRVRIPVDPRADSLNVVAAAAIALHALQPASERRE